MNLKSLTISHKKDLIFTFKKLREKVKEHSNLIKKTKDSELQFFVRDLDPSSTFSFKVHNHEMRSGRVYYHYDFSPASVSNNNPTKGCAPKEGMLSHFSNWISYINEHNTTLNIHPQDSVRQYYIEDFYSKFKLDEENADEVPFSHDKQKLINAFLEESVLQLNDSNEEGRTELIEEAENIQKELGSLTKNEVVFRLAEFVMKLRIFSFQIFQAILEKGMTWGYSKMFDAFLELGS